MITIFVKCVVQAFGSQMCFSIVASIGTNKIKSTQLYLQKLIYPPRFLSLLRINNRFVDFRVTLICHMERHRRFPYFPISYLYESQYVTEYGCISHQKSYNNIYHLFFSVF